MTPLYPVVLFLWACGASAEAPRGVSAAFGGQGGPAMVGQDPLIEQIRRRQISQADGGVRAVVRIASGQSIELTVTDFGLAPLPGLAKLPGTPSRDGLKPLKPAAGLVPAAAKAPGGRKPQVRPSSEQLKVIERQGPRQGWGGTTRPSEKK